MCGIAGIYNPNPGSIPERYPDVVKNMLDRMRLRGPDGEGLWVDDQRRCILGHRRLSIIDISEAGKQPMGGFNSPWVITFNGEIYNFEELRPLLSKQGVQFKNKTDTEVLVQSLTLWGTSMFPKLDGMFAFGAFNCDTGELILARDPFGEKPLYYMEGGDGTISFASELHALELAPGFDPKISVDAFAEYLMFQYIGAPRSIYSQIKKLPPAHWMHVIPHSPIKIQRYFQYSPTSHSSSTRSLDNYADELESILLRSLERRLISDVPLGAFLSGGVDSSVACALIRKKLKIPLSTFSIGFKGAESSEHIDAQTFADHIKADHHCKLLEPNASEFLMFAGKFMDEPNGDNSCMPTYLLSQYARQFVTVAISGDGGDELFFGYGRYFASVEQSKSSDHWDPANYYDGRILLYTQENLRTLLGSVPNGLTQHMHNLMDELRSGAAPLHGKLRKTDAENYMPGAVLPKVDRMSMQNSLEVRTPYLSPELARFAEKLPFDTMYSEGRGKKVLRQLAYRYLPREIIDAPKRGFGIPVDSWSKGNLNTIAERLLHAPDSKLAHVIGRKPINRLLMRQRSARGFMPYELWQVCILESWLQNHPADTDDLKYQLKQSFRQQLMVNSLKKVKTGIKDALQRNSFAKTYVYPALAKSYHGVKRLLSR